MRLDATANFSYGYDHFELNNDFQLHGYDHFILDYGNIYCLLVVLMCMDKVSPVALAWATLLFS